jgi:hypothetical protein
MAFQTTAGILDRFQTVLEAAPCSLIASPNPFTVDQVANAMVNTTYRLRPAGVVSEQGLSNYACARVERFEIILQRQMDMDGYAAMGTLETLIDTVERALIEDGPDQSYNAYAEKGSRKVVRPKGTDIVEATLNMLVDYDYNEQA